MKVPSTMKGKVVDFQFGNYKIECETDKEYLQTLFLIPRQMNGAVVGDSVILEYQTTSSSGLWNVKELIK